MDFDEAGNLGRPGVTGISGATPKPGEVALGRDAARELGVHTGESIEAYAYGESLELRVDRVLPRLGVAGYEYGSDGGSANAFVAPGTIDGLSFPGLFLVEGAPPENLLFISATGGGPGGGRADALLGGVRERLGTQLDSDYELEGVKADLLRDAKEQGEDFGGLFLSFGAFAVAAGVALLVNALVMLTEERRHELGVLRSVGMKRADLAGALVLAGGAYAAVAAAAGAAAGVGICALAVYLAGDIFSSATRGSVEARRFDFEPSTLLMGFLAGLLVSLAVVVGTGAWVSRMTVVETIRGPFARREPRIPRPWTVAVSLLGFLAALAASVLSVATGNDLGSLVFPCGMLPCMAAYLEASARRTPGGGVPAWISVDGVAIAAMAWAVLAFGLLDLDGDDAGLFVAQGLVLAPAAVVLAVRHGARLGSLLRGVGGGPGLALRLALIYPFERRFRTGVTLLAYALIVFTLVFSSVLSGVFSGEVGKLADDEGGGYDLLVTTGSAGPVDTERLEAAGGVREAAALSWTVAGFRVGGTGTFEDWAISGFGDDFLEGGPPALESFDRAEYPNEAAVWRAVHADAGLAIADVAFLESGGGPPEDNARVGDDIQVRAPGTNTTVTRRVVALSAAGAAFSGVMVSRESLAGFVENPVVNRYYAQTAAGSDPGVVAEKLQLDFLRSGLEARPFEAVVREVLRG
ncbi:MAG: FtsX-like permease family protein [Actinomycetota bacterium]|nr:FtsX-like permease family protein [Actinomycetota bacterium]